jgi:hypothetical protein
MPKKKPMKGKPKVNKDLEGLDIEVNEFGEIVNKYDLDKVNEFLNKNVPDKKLGNLGAKKEDDEDWEDPNEEE